MTKEEQLRRYEEMRAEVAKLPQDNPLTQEAVKALAEFKAVIDGRPLSLSTTDDEVEQSLRRLGVGGRKRPSAFETGGDPEVAESLRRVKGKREPSTLPPDIQESVKRYTRGGRA